MAGECELNQENMLVFRTFPCNILEWQDVIGRIQNFLQENASTLQGGANTQICQFFQKLHEIEKNLGRSL